MIASRYNEKPSNFIIAITKSFKSRKCSVVYVIISEPPETQMGPSRSHA